jgi:hypothetical protein
MTDTIEWLETIGKNAALRHASAEELAHTLAQTDASDALKAAAIGGDSSLLAAELGPKPMRVDHHSNAPGHEEEQPDHDHGEHDPSHSPNPDHGNPPHDK